MRRHLILAAAVVGLGIVAVYVMNPFRSPSWSPISRLTGFHLFRVPGPSMEPTLPVDSLLAVCFPAADVHVGDIVVFRYRYAEEIRVANVVVTPSGRETLEIKRVAAMGGSVVEIAESGIEVDGRVSSFFPVGPEGVGRPGRFEVPTGSVFLLGDNLSRSRDSRFLGSIPLEDVLGKVCSGA